MIVHRLAGLALVTALFVLFLAVPLAFADELMPFSATFAETFTIFTGPSCPANALCAAATGVGHATHLGRTTESFTGDVFLPFDSHGCAPESSTGSLTAANGDKIFITSSGTFCQISATNATDVGTWTATRGTGRFAGASGSGTYDTTLEINAPQAGGTSTSTYRGTISSPDEPEPAGNHH